MITLDSEYRTDSYGMPLYAETAITVPAGKRMGALPMSCAPRDVGELFSDKYKRNLVDLGDWPELIKAGEGDHLPYRSPHTYDQDSVGSCAGEGFCNCMMTERARRGQPYVLFNPWPLYYESSGHVDRGSSLDANIRVAKQRGLVPMDLWPRSEHAWNDVPPDSSPIWKEAAKYKPDEVSPVGSIIEMGTAMFLGHAMYAAYPGHAWEMIKLLNTQQGLWLNSWDSDWGDNGVGVISFSKLAFNYGLFAIRTGTIA